MEALIFLVISIIAGSVMGHEYNRAVGFLSWVICFTLLAISYELDAIKKELRKRK